MLSRAVLQGNVSILEGSVIEVQEDGVWVQDANGRQTSVSKQGSAGQFRIGHSVRLAALPSDAQYILIKGLNLTTGTVVQGNKEMDEKMDVSGVMALLRNGLGTMFAVDIRLTMSLIIPLLNGISAIFFAIAAISLSRGSPTPVRVYVNTILIGIGGFLLYLVFFAVFRSIALLAWFAPAVGVFAAYCYIGRILTMQINAAIDKVDRQLGLS